MRIAFFTETFLPATDGVVTRLRYTMDALNRMGDEMFVVAPKYEDGEPTSYAGARVHRAPGVPFPPYPSIKLASPNPGVGRALKRFGPDLIHAVNPLILGASAPYYARKLGVPLISSYHTNVATYARFYKLGFMSEATRWYTRRLHNKASMSLCTSEATRDYLLREGIKRVRIWPQSVDTRRFDPAKASREWRVRLSGGQPDAKILLYVGRLAPEKDIGRLLATLRGAPDARLAIVGDGPARKALEKEFRGTNTVFTGLLVGEDLAAAYASADLFVFPSTTETLGIAMIEALASGLPVVAARAGAVGEVVSEGENGLLYEPGSSAGLAACVHRILEDDALRATLGRRAREAAKQRSWETSTAALRGYYQEVLGRL